MPTPIFHIHYHSETFVKGKVGSSRILGLLAVGICHGAQAHLYQLIICWLIQRNLFPPIILNTLGETIRIRCKDKLFGDATEFNRWVNETGLVAYYQLANPIEMPLSPKLIAAYRALHTNILNDSGAEMEVKYIADTKRYIDKKFDQLAKAMLR